MDPDVGVVKVIASAEFLPLVAISITSLKKEFTLVTAVAFDATEPMVKI